MRGIVHFAAAVLLTAAAVMLAIGTSRSAPPTPAPTPFAPNVPPWARVQGVVPATYADFGLGLLQRLAAEAEAGNVILSPVSAGLAGSMLANGAEGETLDGILRTLTAAEGIEPLNGANAALLEALQSDDIELAVANAMWARQGVQFLPGFLSDVRSLYAAEVATMDFGAPSTVHAMNAWASRSTRGRIPSIIESPLPRDLVLFLANAVYFKGRWEDEFRPAATRERPFETPGGTVQHPLMHRTGEYGHLREDGFSAVRLPYRGGRFAMYVLLPDSGVPLAEVRASLTAEEWARWMNGFDSRDVQLALPRFRLRTGADLIPPLAHMGMGDTFDAERARFTRMADASHLATRNIYVTRANQQVFIEVNEEGTEAAAITSIGAAVESVPEPPVPFIVDRPFLFAIRDDASGALLFVGQVVDPAGV
jgi:serine protease inhibitor